MTVAYHGNSRSFCAQYDRVKPTTIAGLQTCMPNTMQYVFVCSYVSERMTGSTCCSFYTTAAVIVDQMLPHHRPLLRSPPVLTAAACLCAPCVLRVVNQHTWPLATWTSSLTCLAYLSVIAHLMGVDQMMDPIDIRHFC